MMVRYSFLVQAWVWGEPEPPAALPANLARPIVALADRLGQAPLLPYSAYVLDNWARVDKAGPIALDNIRMVQNFLGGADENWFVMIHVAIEAEAGVLLDNAVQLVAAAAREDAEACEALLAGMDLAWERIYAVFKRMPERCDPYIYFHRVRPYIHGWANNPALGEGLVYEGVDKFAGKPQAFRGQTGSQSSIVPGDGRAVRRRATATTRSRRSSTSCTTTARCRTAASSRTSPRNRRCASSSPAPTRPRCATRSTPASSRSPASARGTSNTRRATSTSRRARSPATIPTSAPAARRS